ncbi:hypothetical protein JA1_004090 [Spathaspora sp. JA1]|nr:hypothetical protein JA1_004090 [Spathaspora sp. JA1]
MSTTPAKIRPAKKFIQSSSKCSEQGKLYGECILANYTAMTKDRCANEFNQFKACVVKQLATIKLYQSVHVEIATHKILITDYLHLPLYLRHTIINSASNFEKLLASPNLGLIKHCSIFEPINEPTGDSPTAKLELLNPRTKVTQITNYGPRTESIEKARDNFKLDALYLEKVNVSHISMPFEILQDNYTVKKLTFLPQFIPPHNKSSIHRLKALKCFLILDYGLSRIFPELENQGVKKLKIKHLGFYIYNYVSDTAELEKLDDHFELEYIHTFHLYLAFNKISDSIKHDLQWLFSRLVNVKEA